LSVLILARLRRLYFEANKNQWSLTRGIDEEIGIFFIAQIKLDHDEQIRECSTTNLEANLSLHHTCQNFTHRKQQRIIDSKKSASSDLEFISRKT
jgi:hypothetical protein